MDRVRVIAALALVLVIFAGCGTEPVRVEPPGPRMVEWQKEACIAERLSQSQGKPLLLLFAREGTPASASLERTLREDAEVQSVLDGFVFAKVDVAENASAARMCGVERAPALRIIDPHGRMSSIVHSRSAADIARRLNVAAEEHRRHPGSP